MLLQKAYCVFSIALTACLFSLTGFPSQLAPPAGTFMEAHGMPGTSAWYGQGQGGVLSLSYASFKLLILPPLQLLLSSCCVWLINVNNASSVLYSIRVFAAALWVYCCPLFCYNCFQRIYDVKLDISNVQRNTLDPQIVCLACRT